jgi:DNA repair protein SbcD/Mre11
MIKFFHTADVHFGVENYGRVDSKTGAHSRLLDFKRSFQECIDLAIKEDIDFFLLCGDVYKTAYPTPTQQKMFMHLLLKLYHANIPVVIIVGNHDNPLSFGKVNSIDFLDYIPLDGFYIFSKPSSITIKTKRGTVQIVGMPWPARNNLVTRHEHRFKNNEEISSYISEKVGLLIQDFAEKLDPKIPSVLAGHLMVSSGRFSGSEKCAVLGQDVTFLPSQLAIKPFDYIALGHLHRHQVLNQNSFPAIVYSGSIERIDFGERKEDKGFCRVIIDIDKKAKDRCTFNFARVSTRPMIQIEVKLISGQDQTKQILEQVEKHNLKNAIVKIVYHVPEGQKDKVDLFSIQKACLPAQHLVGIIPIHKSSVRERRVDLKICMDFNSLISKYFDSKKELTGKKDVFIKKALELYQEIENLDDA